MRVIAGESLPRDSHHLSGEPMARPRTVVSSMWPRFFHRLFSWGLKDRRTRLQHQFNSEPSWEESLRCE
jgi:hypothetical protein